MLTSLCGASLLRADEPEIRAELARQRIRTGESVLYRITISHAEDAPRPELAGLSNIDVTPQGESSQNRVVIINNRRLETRGRSYDYLLSPRGTGRFEIPAPRVSIGGRTYEGNPLTLLVEAPQPQDLAILELATEREVVYPLQPFTVTLRVLIKQLPPPLEEEDPIAVLRDPPKLSVPWVDDSQLADGLEPQVPWQRWLQAWQNPRGAGFRMNGIRAATMFSLFDDSGMGFLPTPRQVRRDDLQGRSTGYWQYEFPRTFTARQVGTLTFGPARLEGQLIARIKNDRVYEGESVYAMVEPIKVRVQDVPAEGRPDSYIQAIGTFDLTADVAPRQARVGDPLTLTIAMRGTGTLDAATPPDIQSVPGIAENFRVYDATSQTDGDRKQFVYSLRPLHERVREFPSIPISYFDVGREQYVTLLTDQIPLDIQAADRLAAGDILAGSPARSSAAMEARRQGLFANVTDVAAVRDDRVPIWSWTLGLTGLSGVYAATLLAVWQFQRRARDQVTARRRCAVATAQRQLAIAGEHLDAGRLRPAADEINQAFMGLIAAAALSEPTGMTSADAGRHLRQLEVDDSLVGEVVQLLETCDGTRYGGLPVAGVNLGRQASELLDRLVASLKSKKCLA